MKLAYLPIRLISFWYPESLVFFLRTLKNLFLLLEEDFAIKLMFKLLFVPLFHDASITGRMLSILFRLSRILLGLFAFVCVVILVFVIAIIWFTLPVVCFLINNELGLLLKLFFFSGLILFGFHILAHPLKKVWQIKRVEDIWQSSKVSKKNVELMFLLKSENVRQFLVSLEKTPKDFINFPKDYSEVSINQKAWDIAKQIKAPYLTEDIFFVSIILSIPEIENELMKMNLSTKDFIDTLDYLQKKADRWRMIPFWDEDFAVHHLRGVNRGWLGTPTPTLDSVCDDFTKQATTENIADFVGRKEVVSQVINTLSLSEGRNVILVAEPGSGKAALVKFLAKIIVAGDAPPALTTKRIVSLDFTRLLSGIKEQGELAEKLKTIFDEANYSGNIIIYVDEIQNFGLGEAGASLNLLSLLLPFIESSKIQFITTTEPVNYSRVLERNSAFLRNFTRVDLPPASLEDTIKILQDRSIDYSRKAKIQTTMLAIREMADLSQRYIHDRVLPDSAIHLFKQSQVNQTNGWITKNVVEKTIQSSVKIPVGDSSVEAKKQVLNLEETIHQRFIDQEEAVTTIASTLRRATAGLREQQKPIGSFLFVGPTGVGKTELAKILSETYFLEKGNFLRLDMSEFQNTDAIKRLIGDEFNEGLITDVIRTKPFSLILLDEFEKADKNILNLFLQVFDDGRLTDGKGRVIDFSNTIIIATSNAASLTIAQNLQQGKTVEQIQPLVKEELMKVYTPELLNRFDATVIFKPLSKADLQKIVILKLASLKEQLKLQGYIVDFSEDLIAKLAEKGFDQVMGARPLRRLIQDTLEARLSVMILEGKVPKGEKIILDQQVLI
ncbi:MAG: ATP-dependent Clp protease ATP-binding subunit [Candidatus Daviesbacteria bacterium]|nr:ATP-dependent Clp protease ATP-binding subunit [Candidatus Daviesbacteria bacterium]